MIPISNFFVTSNAQVYICQSKMYTLRCSFLAISLLCIAFPMRAQTVSWKTNASSSSWTNTSNWVGGVIPGSTDTVYIPASDNNPILTGNRTIARLRIEGAGLENAKLTVNGTLNITGSQDNAIFVRLGELTINSTRTVNVNNVSGDGLVTTWNASIEVHGTMNFGNTASISENGLNLGAGTFDIMNGGLVTINNTGAAGVHNVSADVDIEPGGTLRVGNLAAIGTFGVWNQLEMMVSPHAGSDTARLEIDRAGIAALHNGLDFVNGGVVTIGGLQQVDSIGVLNNGTLINSSDASISINDLASGVPGIANADSISNAGSILIGCNSSSKSGNGIVNSGGWLNESSSSICLSNLDTAIVQNGLLISMGAIDIGSAGPCDNGLYASSRTTIADPGELYCDSISNVCITVLLDTLNCTGSIYLGANNSIGTGMEIHSAVVVSGNGRIDIDDTGTACLQVFSGAYYQQGGTLRIGLNKSINGAGLNNLGRCLNTGDMYIENNIGPSGAGIVNFPSASFVNEGYVLLGNTGSISQFGVYNQGDFNNAETGEFFIRNVNGTAFRSFSNVDNYGLLAIGDQFQIAQTGTGLQTSGLFDNYESGILRINNQGNDALSVSGNDLINAGEIIIGNESGVNDGYGINVAVSGDLENTTTGVIRIDNVSEDAVINFGDFNNSGKLYIGGTGSIGDLAIRNLTTFDNVTCKSLIHVLSDNAILTFSPNFTNDGNIIEHTSDSCHISTNNGFIQNLGGGDFTMDSGTAPVTKEGLFWTGCTDSIWVESSNWAEVRVPTDGDRIVIRAIVPSPTVTPATVAMANSIEVRSGAELNIAATGTLSVPTPGDIALDNKGTVVNHGSVVIGDQLLLEGDFVGIETSGFFDNYGDIEISNLDKKGIHSSGGFINRATGTIEFDNILVGTGSNLESSLKVSNDSLVNFGLIAFGNISRCDRGVYVEDGVLVNKPGGVISVNNVKFCGVALGSGGGADTGRLFNHGLIEIGAGTEVITGSLYGAINVLSRGYYYNMADGTTTVDNLDDDEAVQMLGTGVFHNYGELILAMQNPIGRAGIWMAHTTVFNNHAGAYIKIGNVGGTGISAWGVYMTDGACTFNNWSKIEMMNLSGPGVGLLRGYGIFNNIGCPALLMSHGDHRIYSSPNGSSYNSGSIVENYSGSSNIHINVGMVQNLNGGTFTIDSGNVAVVQEGLLWTGCKDSLWNESENWTTTMPTDTSHVAIPITLNNPIVDIGGNAYAASVDVASGAALTVLTGARLNIDDFSSFGIRNNGDVMNWGILSIGLNSINAASGFENHGQLTNHGTIEVAGTEQGLVSDSTINNEPGALIRINGQSATSVTDAAFNVFDGAMVSNHGVVRIGRLTAVERAIRLSASQWMNYPGAIIEVDRASSNALVLRDTSYLLNEGTLAFGLNSPLAGADLFFDEAISLYEQSTIENQGTITVDNVDNLYGILLGDGRIDNYGEMYFGEYAELEQGGIWIASSSGKLNNYAYALIRLNQVSRDGSSPAIKVSNSGEVENFGTIETTTFLPSGTPALSVVNAGSYFYNRTCQSLLDVQGSYSITSSIEGKIVNEGRIKEWHIGTSVVDTNWGFIQNLAGGEFNVLHGNQAIESFGFLWTGCKDSLWNDEENWLDLTIPTGSTTVLIPGVARYPRIYSVANTKALIIDDEAQLAIESIGVLNINNSTGVALRNSGSVLNDGQVNIGQNGTIGTWGVRNTGDIHNRGIIRIDDCEGIAFTESRSTWNDTSGQILIGHGPGNVFLGLNVKDTLINDGVISIQNNQFTAMDNIGGWVENRATGNLNIGTIQPKNEIGIDNKSYFSNKGIIRIESKGVGGLTNDEGIFENKDGAQLLINETTDSISTNGIITSGVIVNQASTIHIFNAGNIGLEVLYAGQFVNLDGAILNIGVGGNIAARGIVVQSDANSGMDDFINDNSEILITNFGLEGIRVKGGNTQFVNRGKGLITVID